MHPTVNLSLHTLLYSCSLHIEYIVPVCCCRRMAHCVSKSSLAGGLKITTLCANEWPCSLRLQRANPTQTPAASFTARENCCILSLVSEWKTKSHSEAHINGPQGIEPFLQLYKSGLPMYHHSKAFEAFTAGLLSR